MKRSDFQKLAEIRIAEAEILLKAKKYDGAYYLAGYAVECALKACVAKRTARYDYPDKDLANQCYTHKLVTGRRDGFSTIRTPGGLSGFAEPSE